MRDIEKLSSFLEAEKIDVLDVRLEDLERFTACMSELGIGARSLSRVLSGIRHFYRFLILDGYLEIDPTELLESPKQPKHLPEVLSTAEVDIILNSIDLTKWEGQRNKAIIEVLFSCGLRVSELTSLKISNLYFQEQYVRIMGKGSKERLVPISPRAIEELNYWFLDRSQMKIKEGEDDYVFLNRRGSLSLIHI